MKVDKAAVSHTSSSPTAIHVVDEVSEIDIPLLRSQYCLATATKCRMRDATAQADQETPQVETED